MKTDLQAAARIQEAFLPQALPDLAGVRGDFLDWSVETGLRFPRQARALEVFAAAERRNDVFLLVPGARTRALFGARIRLREGD